MLKMNTSFRKIKKQKSSHKYKYIDAKLVTLFLRKIKKIMPPALRQIQKVKLKKIEICVVR